MIHDSTMNSDSVEIRMDVNALRMYDACGYCGNGNFAPSAKWWWFHAWKDRRKTSSLNNACHIMGG